MGKSQKLASSSPLLGEVNNRSWLAVLLLYVGLAGAIAKWVLHDSSLSFRVLAALIAARAVFGILALISSELVYWTKRTHRINCALAFLKAHGFPKKRPNPNLILGAEFSHDYFNYLGEIQATEDYPPELRILSDREIALIEGAEPWQGIRDRMRHHAILDEALKRHLESA